MDLRNLGKEKLEDLWHKIQGKKYAYGYGRGTGFVERCYAIQRRADQALSLLRYRDLGIEADCPFKANIIYMKEVFHGPREA